MGRAMLIICAGTLISLGIISISTSQQGKMMTSNAVKYANEITAKNAAHTAIQSAMQKINEKNHRTHSGDWANEHGETNPWTPTIDGSQITLYVEYLNEDWDTNPYFEPDSIRMVSKANYLSYESEVVSVYEYGAFSTLVPDFEGALQLPTGFGTFNVDGNAHEINGGVNDCDDGSVIPPLMVDSQETKDNLPSNMNLNGGDIEVDNDLNYEPTDELIERLKNSGNATIVDSDFGDQLGSADDPGVFFIDGDVKLSGSQKEGFGILVIQADAGMEMEDPDLSVAGNFTFNGLVIFENAYSFKGSGTPTINGSVLIGDTSDGDADIDVDLGGNIEINYDCIGERYANMAAADATEQNRYVRLVTYE